MFVERESVSVITACSRILRDPTEAQDAAQDTFVQAFRALATYRGDGPFGAWLRRIAVRVAIARVAARPNIVTLDELVPDRRRRPVGGRHRPRSPRSRRRRPCRDRRRPSRRCRLRSATSSFFASTATSRSKRSRGSRATRSARSSPVCRAAWRGCGTNSNRGRPRDARAARRSRGPRNGPAPLHGRGHGRDRACSAAFRRPGRSSGPSDSVRSAPPSARSSLPGIWGPSGPGPSRRASGPGRSRW